MRTTLTLDDDVAAELERLRRKRRVGLKELVNEALREGLTQMISPKRRTTRYRTRVHDGGRCLLPNLDCMSEVLAIIEGEDYR